MQMQAGRAHRMGNMLVAIWFSSCAAACRLDGPVGWATCWLPFCICLSTDLLGLSGVCVCGSDGHGFVGTLAGAIPSWDGVHDVDAQMRGGVCAGISGDLAVVSTGVPCC